MNTEDLSMEEIQKQFKRAFTTESGRIVLEYLQEQYRNLSCLSDTPEKTYYFLGKSELVQHITQLVTEDIIENVVNEIEGGALDE